MGLSTVPNPNHVINGLANSNSSFSYSDFRTFWSQSFNPPVRSQMLMTIEEGEKQGSGLKTGGPEMSVEHVDTAFNLIECVWVCDGVRPNRKTFGLNVLEKLHDSSALHSTVHVTDTPEIRDSLKAQSRASEKNKIAFIMMRFSQTDPHNEIVGDKDAVSTFDHFCHEGPTINHFHSDVFSEYKNLYARLRLWDRNLRADPETDDANPNVALSWLYVSALDFWLPCCC